MTSAYSPKNVDIIPGILSGLWDSPGVQASSKT
jgi:hypothetical protein